MVEVSGNLNIYEFAMPALIFDQRDSVLAVMWDAYMSNEAERDLAEKSNLTFQKFAVHHAAHEAIGISVAGQIAGGALLNSGSIHLAVLPEFRSRWFKAWAMLRDYAFGKCGDRLIATAGKGNAAANKFIKQVGFVLSNEGEHTLSYVLNRNEVTQ